MLNSIKIFLLAILIVSCEQEPFETEVQNNNYVSVEYVTGTGDDLPYEWNNITQMFMVPYDLSDFDLDFNEIIIIN